MHDLKARASELHLSRIVCGMLLEMEFKTTSYSSIIRSIFTTWWFKLKNTFNYAQSYIILLDDKNCFKNSSGGSLEYLNF